MMNSGGSDNFDPEEHIFESPTKLIKTVEDMKIWEKSEAYYEYLGFIIAVNEAVKGKSNAEGGKKLSETVQSLIGMLNKIDDLITEIPPIQQPQRFGNQAFRTWYNQLKTDALKLLQVVLPPLHFRAIPEIVIYLIDGFGNSTRIDYGTGHEISFLMFLCALFKIGLLQERDRAAVGCLVFPRYLEVCRRLQQVYRMEPAGSHGVWSLDDYQFVPFIWGSSQLYCHPRIEPPSFLKPDILKEYAKDYMFLSCIDYIKQVKTGPFAEHSNQLWSISGVSSWSKVNGGLIKMYKVEVLSKFPVVQHIVFGSIFTLRAVEQSTGLIAAKTSFVARPKSKDEPSSVSTSRSSSVKTQSEEILSENLSEQPTFKIPSFRDDDLGSVKTTSTRASVRTDTTIKTVEGEQGSVKSEQGNVSEQKMSIKSQQGTISSVSSAQGAIDKAEEK